MLNASELQFYLEQDRVVKAVLAFLAFILFICVVQLLQSTIMPAKPALEAKAPQAHHQTFVPTPLFGKAPTSGVLQQTRLQLTLKGTFAASQSATGSAIIGSDKGDQIYVIGDTVEGAIIRDIQPDYVILEYQGNNEILRLPEGQRLTAP